MDDLDFTATTDKTPASDSVSFDPAAALDFFESAGRKEEIAAGEIIFVENTKSSHLLFQRDKMYLLLDGSIQLTVQGEKAGAVQKGEIFGEIASITQTSRSATATATSNCRVISLDDKQFKDALQEKPEFALTLMALMAARLRNMVRVVNRIEALDSDTEWNESFALNKNLLADLAEELGDSATMRYEQGKTIMHEGQAGVLMYIVLEGSVTISIQGTVVEMVGTGGIFGEMALIDRSMRVASASAQTDCSLLAINHGAFLGLVKDNPEFGVAILSAIGERARYMISQLSSADD